jgi:hypothetical protein
MSRPERQISNTALLRAIRRRWRQHAWSYPETGQRFAAPAWFTSGLSGSWAPMRSGWRKQSRPAARRWRVRGPAGCLLWVVILVLILLVLSVLFGGFQRGTKAEPAGRPPVVSVAW